jgi:hypothetical protein
MAPPASAQGSRPNCMDAALTSGLQAGRQVAQRVSSPSGSAAHRSAGVHSVPCRQGRGGQAGGAPVARGQRAAVARSGNGGAALLARACLATAWRRGAAAGQPRLYCRLQVHRHLLHVGG